jgi:hypothetical protein
MPFEILHRVAPVRTEVSEECIASIFRVTRISLTRTTDDCSGAVKEAPFAVRPEAYPLSELRRFKFLVTLKMEAICSSETSVLTRVTLYNISKDIHNFTKISEFLFEI